MNVELKKVIEESTSIPMITDPKTMEVKRMSKTEAESLQYKAKAIITEMKLKHENDFVVADHYQLGKLHGKQFSLESKNLITAKQMVAVAHLLHFNSDWTNTGQIYVLDETATDERNEASEKHRIASDKRREAEENKRSHVTMAPVKVLCGVSKDGKLYENIDEAEKADYAFTGSKLKCDEYIAGNFGNEKATKTSKKTTAKNKTKLPCGVDKEFEVYENVSPDEEKDYIYIGIEADCDSFAEQCKEFGFDESTGKPKENK